jgi:hypothetical protein
MQVSCFGLDWTEVQKRPDARAVVEEMIYGDAGDRYVRALPEGMWTSDSATLHFESADLLLADWPETDDQSQDEALRALSELITTGDAIDELGISPLTEGCYFLSLSPELIVEFDDVLQKLAADTLVRLHSLSGVDSPSQSAFVAYVQQWVAALNFARQQGVGLIGHCG